MLTWEQASSLPSDPCWSPSLCVCPRSRGTRSRGSRDDRSTLGEETTEERGRGRRQRAKETVATSVTAPPSCASSCEIPRKGRPHANDESYVCLDIIAHVGLYTVYTGLSAPCFVVSCDGEEAERVTKSLAGSRQGSPYLSAAGHDSFRSRWAACLLPRPRRPCRGPLRGRAPLLPCCAVAVSSALSSVVCDGSRRGS